MSGESVFPEQLRFRYTWRPYQARVLEELETHLDDDKLHVVAAPGAGKTILGLEVLIRLNKPTLILSPTITIRNQWMSRLSDLFLSPSDQPRDWISTDIRNPGLITSITYQALHCALTGEDETDELEETDTISEEKSKDTPYSTHQNGSGMEIVSLLEGVGVQTVVLDECHHLRTDGTD
jgi:superfamily II DNA or RNA helicase